MLYDGEELDLSGPLRELVRLRRGADPESAREAVAQTLRGAAGRPVLGNVSPPETGDVLRALASGRHHGSLLATGAMSADAALLQLATRSLADGFSWGAARSAIPKTIHALVRLDRLADGTRRAVEATHVEQAPSGWALRPA